MSGTRLMLVWLPVAACTTPAPSAPSVPPAATCDANRPVRVVDEAGAPVAGARVRMLATSLQCGPSGLPEACGSRTDESPVAVTSASGIANVCELAIPFGRYVRGSVVVVEYGDWPTAMVAAGAAQTITIGPGRSAIVEVPAGCTGMQHVHVHAYADGGGGPVTATPIAGGLRSQRYRLANLGPWRYWVRSRDDRSGNSAVEADACASFARALDGRHVSATLILDRSDLALEAPTFGNGRVTASVMNGDGSVVTTAVLDADGRALLSVPASAGTAWCLRIEKDDRCWITYAHAGGLVGPEQYMNRSHDAALRCGRCD